MTLLLLDQWMLVMSTQMIGFSVGGLARKLVSSVYVSQFDVSHVSLLQLVAPASMSASSFPSLSELSLTIVIVWPNTLVTCAMFNTLHSQNYAGIGRRDGISRERFFAYAFLAAALWCTYYSSFFIAIPLSSPPLPHICHPCLLTSPRQPKL